MACLRRRNRAARRVSLKEKAAQEPILSPIILFRYVSQDRREQT